MDNFRCYGDEPFKVVVVHGGPGALGDMGYVASRISSFSGVIEALQTKSTISELVDELVDTIMSQCEGPVILIGHSWGAWLAYIVAAKYPDLVSKLVLVGSGPFTNEYVKQIESTRIARLDSEERKLLEGLIEQFYSADATDKSGVMTNIGKIIEIADTYSCKTIDDSNYRIKVDGDMFSSIWSEASKLRSTGELLDLALKLKCEVTVIHGDYDPHPVAGVIKPLSDKIETLKSVVLTKCGHSPWKELYAHDEFFSALREVIR